MTLDRLMKMVAAVNRKRYPEKLLLEKIKNDGLSFTPSNETLQKLSDAHAPQSVVEEVRRCIPVPPPPPPNGKLTVLCEPVDCLISIDKKMQGSTDKGKSQEFSLKEGSYAVGAYSEDYQTEQPEKPLKIEGGGVYTLPFRFQPTREALERAGKNLYDSVVSIMGGTPLLKDSTAIRAAGTVTLSSDRSAWDFAVYCKGPEHARFVLKRGGRKYTVVHNGGYHWEKKSPPEAPGLEDVLMRACRFQVASLLRQLGTPQFTLVTDRLVPLQGSDSLLRAEGAPDTYVVKIDQLLHVSEVTIESPGLNNGTRALYGDYSGPPNRLFARITQVLLPEVPNHPRVGVEVQYSDVVYSPPELTDDMFAVKSK